MKKLIYIFLLLTLLFSVNSANSQWIETGKPSVIIYSVAVKDNLIFVGTPMGVYRTVDLGKNWTPINVGVINLYVTSFAISNNTIIAGTKDQGLFRSTDNGDSWISANRGITNTKVNDIVVSGNDIIVSAGDYLYISYDNAENWNMIPGISGVKSLLAKNNILFASGVDGIYKTTDKGEYWDKVSYTISAKVLAANEDYIFAGTEAQGVYLSPDLGKTWNKAINGMPDFSTVNALTVIGSNVFAGTELDGIYFSYNNGSSWTKVNNGLSSYKITTLKSYHTELFAGTYAGLFYSTDNGSSWQNISGSISNEQPITCLIAKDNKIFAGTDQGRVLTSTDNGNEWLSLSNTGLLKEEQGRIVSAVGKINSLEYNTNSVYAGTDKGIFRSFDDGNTWKPISDGIKNIATFSLGTYLSTLYAGTAMGLYETIDDGRNWKLTQYAALTSGKISALAIKNGNIYAALNGNIFCLLDKGTDWTNTSFERIFDITQIAFNNDYVFASTLGGGIYRSNIDGRGWSDYNDGLGNLNVTCVITSGETIICGTNGAGIYYSTNNGGDWVQLNAGLKDTRIRSLVLLGETVFAGTDTGKIFKISLREFVDR